MEYRGMPDIRDRDLPGDEQTQALSFTKAAISARRLLNASAHAARCTAVHRIEFGRCASALGKYELRGHLAEITTAQRVSTAAGEKNLGLAIFVASPPLPESQVDLAGIKQNW